MIILSLPSFQNCRQLKKAAPCRVAFYWQPFTPYLVGLLPVGLEAVLSILDKCCEKRGWHKWLLYRAVAMVWRWYYDKVMLELQQEKEFYRNHVVAKCIEDTPVFAEHRELCKL